MKDKAKRGPATWECANCNYWCYSGSSDKNYEELKAKHPEQKWKKEKVRDDHIEPVINPKEGFVDWNTLVERMLAPEENWQALCDTCHDEKTKKEREERKKWKQKKKD